jgi:hypothetical protein
VPRWSETKEESKKVMSMKRKMLMDVGTFDSLDKSLEIEISIQHVDDYNECKVLKRLQRLLAAKDELKNHVMKECPLKAQAKAIVDRATITLKKT